MTFDWHAEVVQQLEFHWTQQLGPRLEGLLDEEYLWEPVPGMWSIRRSPTTGQLTNDCTIPPPDPEPPTTIAWRMHHLVMVFETAMVQVGGEEVSWDRTSVPADSADGAVQLLHQRLAEWLENLNTLGQDELEQPARTQFTRDAGLSVAGTVLHTHRELIHHGAEIALLRDLFRAQNADENLGAPKG